MRIIRCHILWWLGGWLFVPHFVQAQQLKLGNHPLTHTKSAVLEMESTNQGFLPTRIADTALINAYHPPDGLVIYFTDGKATEPYGENSGLYERTNGAWNKIRQTIDTAVDASQSAIKFTHENNKVVLHLPNATTGLRGVVSAGRQSFSGRKTFNDSVRVKNLHAGSIVFIRGGTDTLNHVLTENNAQFFWDDVNERLGVGTRLPAARIDVNGDFKLGTQGSVLSGIIRHTYTTPSLASINAKSDLIFSVTVAGVVPGGSVIISPADELPDGLVIAYGYTSAGIVYFKLANTSETSVNIPAGTQFYISVIQ